jgi:O-acetyl-ADP-ribose deacetylase (regulator of RNase III)
VAKEYNLRSISFPSISTGIYGYPVADAARIALRTVVEELKTPGTIETVRFVLFDARTLAGYEAALEELR